MMTNKNAAIPAPARTTRTGDSCQASVSHLKNAADSIHGQCAMAGTKLQAKLFNNRTRHGGRGEHRRETGSLHFARVGESRAVRDPDAGRLIATRRADRGNGGVPPP